ncbi:MAG TPA: hypothetical protein GX513_08770 [Firmicutes bacterium]|nr:hypothetical protein [Bacillota bacterium]
MSGRVYQAFLAPPNTARIYVTVKVPGSRGSPNITYAGTQPVEIRVYGDPDSFANLDQAERAIVDVLHGAEVTDAVDLERYSLSWVPGGGDFADEELRLIGRLLLFEAAALHEPGGGS